MNILRPELVWVEGRCYRVNDPLTEITPLQEQDLYEDEQIFQNVDNEGDVDDFEVTKIDETRYSTSFHISKPYIGSIIGKKGANKMRIERDTKTEIKIPRQGQTGDIVIFGPSEANVKAARRRINIIVISARMKQKATHFISIPMNSPEIVNNFETFKENVLRECPDRGLDASLFIRPTKLHLTLGVMCLMDSEERLQASKLMTEAKRNVIMPMLKDYLPLRLRLKGLAYMNDDPHEIDVLYGIVQEENAPEGLLQQLADRLVDHFYKAGFMDRDYGRDNVKLHVTLINSKYRNPETRTNLANPDEPNSAIKRARHTFDGSRVLEKFIDYEFGTADVPEIHLSQRHAIGADGYYQPTYVITCQTS